MCPRFYYTHDRLPLTMLNHPISHARLSPIYLQKIMENAVSGMIHSFLYHQNFSDQAKLQTIGFLIHTLKYAHD